MNKAQVEWKVGLFVVIALALLVALIINFRKGATLLKRTYDVVMVSENVWGIIPGAPVSMAGVQVGHVVAAELDASGKIVRVHLRIEDKYKVYSDARFSIRQMGFLGDRFVMIAPAENKGRIIRDGDEVLGEQPFDLQEVAQSAAGLLRRVDDTAKMLNDAVKRIDHTLFAADTLTNLTLTVSNFKMISDRALVTLHGINEFVRTNTHPLSTSVSNLVLFSSQLNNAASELYLTVATNRAEVTAVVKNIESASTELDKLVTDLQAGKGLAGSLLKNQELERQVFDTFQNLNLLSSNLNKFGLLWKPKAPRAVSPAYSGRRP